MLDGPRVAEQTDVRGLVLVEVDGVGGVVDHHLAAPHLHGVWRLAPIYE
jgi:hypothetical protein